MRLKVPASKPARGVAGMLKYLSKFAMDILPSVVATIIGAYIVNHYIVTKPGTDAPVAAAVSTADPKAGVKAAPEAPRPSIHRRRQHPRAGRQGQGHLRKGHHREDRPSKSRPWRKPPRKPARNPPTKPAETASIPAEPRRRRPAPREKAVAKSPAPRCRRAGRCCAESAPPVEAAVAPEEHRDANDLARAAIERLRGE